jgi:fibronectin type 3 domain-containing protein
LPVTDLAVVERGDKLVIQFTVPTRTTEDIPLADDPQLVATVGDKTYPIEAQSAMAHAEIDAKPFYGRDIRIFVKALNDRKLDGGFSNVVSLRVVAALPAPANLKAVAVAEGVRVSWDGPEKEFTVFRQGPGDKALVKLETVAAPPYIDKNTEYGKEYLYAVMASEGPAIQSDIAQMAKPLVPVDTFAPAVPLGLAAVIGTQSVELVWDRSVENDLAGYRIYRDAGSGQFERIGESHDAPGFSDKKVEMGKRYRYAVTAYDKAGNESGLSEVVEALIP